MPKRKCFFEEPPKKSNMFPYINRLHGILKDRDPFPFIRMPSQPPGARPPDSRGAFGPRQDQDPRACDRGVRRMLTCMAHHPVDNSILHGMRRFTRRSWRSAKRAQAHATSPTRTHPFRHPTHPSVRTHPATIPFPPAKPNQLRGINNLHAHTSHPSHPL